MITQEDMALQRLIDALPGLFARYPEGVDAPAICAVVGRSYTQVMSAVRRLDRLGVVVWIEGRAQGRRRKVMLPPPPAMVEDGPALSFGARPTEPVRISYDRFPPRSGNVTRNLMGDPTPGRTPWAAP